LKRSVPIDIEVGLTPKKNAAVSIAWTPSCGFPTRLPIEERSWTEKAYHGALKAIPQNFGALLNSEFFPIPLTWVSFRDVGDKEQLEIPQVRKDFGLMVRQTIVCNAEQRKVLDLFPRAHPTQGNCMWQYALMISENGGQTVLTEI
jgi:hypothetical protein